MASLTWGTWVWASSRSWWWTGECCSPQGHKESDMTEWLNWTELMACLCHMRIEACMLCSVVCGCWWAQKYISSVPGYNLPSMPFINNLHLVFYPLGLIFVLSSWSSNLSFLPCPPSVLSCRLCTNVLLALILSCFRIMIHNWTIPTLCKTICCVYVRYWILCYQTHLLSSFIDITSHPRPLLTLVNLSDFATWCQGVCYVMLGFPGGSDGKESPANTGDLGSIPGSGRSSGGRNGNPLQYSCLENPVDRRAWRAAVHGVTQIQTWLKWLCSSGSSNYGSRVQKQNFHGWLVTASLHVYMLREKKCIYNSYLFLKSSIFIECILCQEL